MLIRRLGTSNLCEIQAMRLLSLLSEILGSMLLLFLSRFVFLYGVFVFFICSWLIVDQGMRLPSHCLEMIMIYVTFVFLSRFLEKRNLCFCSKFVSWCFSKICLLVLHSWEREREILFYFLVVSYCFLTIVFYFIVVYISNSLFIYRFFL